MKRELEELKVAVVAVAPLAGAWIETMSAYRERLLALVAPLAGAWIETRSCARSASAMAWSPPSRGRGLKRLQPSAVLRPLTVAPLAGAWIETWMSPAAIQWLSGSPPSRGRGLKLHCLQ